MNSLWYVIDFIIRILTGERFRKATADEKKTYAASLNLLALLVLFYPWFIFLIENYSHIIIWLGVMAFLFPAVMIMCWNRESLPLRWSVFSSFLIIAVPIVLLVLSILGVQLKYNRTVSAITSAVYLAIIISIRFVTTPSSNKHEDSLDSQ